MFQDNSVSTVATMSTALAPAFAAGFAVQQLLEIVDNVFSLDKKMTPATKGWVMGLISLGLGFALAYPTHGIRILAALSSAQFPEWMNVFVSALVISAGTEGFNSIMKFAGYKKDAAKKDAEKP